MCIRFFIRYFVINDQNGHIYILIVKNHCEIVIGNMSYKNVSWFSVRFFKGHTANVGM